MLLALRPIVQARLIPRLLGSDTTAERAFRVPESQSVRARTTDQPGRRNANGAICPAVSLSNQSLTGCVGWLGSVVYQQRHTRAGVGANRSRLWRRPRRGKRRQAGRQGGFEGAGSCLVSSRQNDYKLLMQIRTNRLSRQSRHFQVRILSPRQPVRSLRFGFPVYAKLRQFRRLGL